MIFPVGHLLGPCYDGIGGEHYTRVRIGGTPAHLRTDAEVIAWMLAHGLSDSTELAATIWPSGRDPTWSRSGVVALTGAMGMPDPTPAIDTLVADGLLAEVDPAAAGDFARRHRLCSLMIGLGMVGDDPDRFAIGFAGRSAVDVDPLLFEVWEWAPMAPSLWSLCEVVSEVGRATGDQRLSTEDVLDTVVGRLHRLLAVNAVYLDVAEGC